MEVVDRNKSPQVNQIKKIDLLRASETKLKNGIPVYHIKAGTQDLVKIELLFPAGMWHQTYPLVGSAASTMLNEGTSKRSAKEISEMLDYYGAFLHTEITHDFAVVGVHSLNKHLPHVLSVIEELISDSVFPQDEWDIYLQNKRQSFIVNNKKVSFVSRKKFAELLFGNDHPYGHNVMEDDFDKLKKEDAYNFYKKTYTAKGTIIVAAGNVTDSTLKLIEKYFGCLPQPPPLEGASRVKVLPNGEDLGGASGGSFLEEKKDALQSAIRIGKMLFTKPHPDYCAMQVVNTIFGGYFGSRLMANIREDKGYTYGIGSAVVSFSHAGYFTISTEVGAEVTKDAIKEIYFELSRMQTEKVSESELALVRNYMLGAFLRSIDGPFALADRFKGIYFSGLDYDYYNTFIETIRTITPEKIMELANKYLKKEEMIELVVGKK
ncbi:MAG: insulinase family protein [Bacteroidetes bacterium]|nr:insulinase family protein [Bacteroidota bacterium]